MLSGLADTIPLSSGASMPRLGLGTYKAEDGNEVARAVRFALEIGYRGVDTASLYGNETGVGSGIRTSGVPREDIFLTTKVWNDEQGYERTRTALANSLDRLGVDYVDLYLVHWPIPSLMRETWRAMEELCKEGRARSIGVCNFLPHHLETLERDAETMPAVNQFEFHPRLQQPDVVTACEARGIVVQAWAPLMKGRVGETPEIARIARELDRTPAQVAVRWILQRGFTTIPKSVHEGRIRENASVFDFELDRRQMGMIDGLDLGERLGPDPDNYA